jgi:hypothetical protein
MRLRDDRRSRFGEETRVPSLLDEMRFKRRERDSVVAANVVRGHGWRRIHTETINVYDIAAARIPAEDVEIRTRGLMAAWANEGGSI